MKNLALVVVFVLVIFSPPGKPYTISHNTVKTWAHKLGFELSQLGKYVTNVEKFSESYKAAKFLPQDGNDLVREIAKSIKAMMESKISAIKRIMDIAEESAKSSKDDDIPEDWLYVNAKNNTLDFTFSAHFGGEVNLNLSSVHVPTNVYDRAREVIKAIKWSEELDHTFISNFDQDPSLSWQYFGSATGFMRQFPGTTWTPKPVDLFDCRTRGWYIEAATSPKDVLILVDVSGSMTGKNKEIAKHVVDNILDTLGNNDYVNIITFSNVTLEVVPCFNGTLVQANLANLRELKEAILELKTDQIANFSLVLNYAFELLEQFREEKEGAMCNQAIMLVTDGVPFNFKEIFQRYNWRERPDEPDKADMPVRVFTYLIGREVADVREVKWMACANRGYYVHLSSYPEVREKVLNYVPVMARPLVLNGKDHPTIWTPVYADITDPKMADWKWEQRECEEQKQRFFRFRKDKKFFVGDQRDRRFAHKPRKYHDYHNDLQEYQLMTSVSMPVYDRRENANITEQVLIKEAYWVTQTRETRIADLLGVAGTDVPIKEIQKLMAPHKLGVNGYAFIVTNNGYVLIHPDLRPVFEGILKPSYNSVDMAEVELMDLGKGPRDFDEGILSLRDDVINQTPGSATLFTKYHYDNMKRVGRMKRKYDYRGIESTPFTVVVSLPEHGHAGSYRVKAEEEIHRSTVEGKIVTDYFADSNWRVHPDWDYCKYHYEGEHKFNSSERQLLHFLERTRQPGWKWIESRQRSQPPEHSAANSSGSEHSKPKQTQPNPSKSTPTPDKNSYFCDRSLLQSLVFDAKVTAWFANINTTREEKGKEFQQRFGFTLAFMATHSGLTRWQDFNVDNDTTPLAHHFSNLYSRAIDEIWYKRAVEHNYLQPDSFVFSVPIDDAGADNTTLVTASRAIFIGDEKKKAPVAVVGFQFQHTALQGLFQSITFSCDKNNNCENNCFNDSLACYLVDNNGYIVVAEAVSDAGKFFGEVRGPVMARMVEEGIFDKIRIFDYQAVCYRNTQTSNDGTILFTPWKTMQRTFSWIMSHIVWTWAKMGLWESDYTYAWPDPSEEEGSAQNHYDNDDKSSESGSGGDKAFLQKNVFLNKTKRQSCDKEVYLYLLRNGTTREYDVDYDSTRGCDRPFVVQPVSFSNLLLVVVDTNCPDTAEPSLSVEPEEVLYPNTTLACQKAMNELRRQRPHSCIRNHTRESEIKDRCGDASSFGPNVNLLALMIIVLALAISRIGQN
ncbi:voltage-dependent calcium channel subunit alpha-2/delta-3 isoform X3 [Venturia canescens]|uniref:voltage-dependent calcium channel subunit alpha-2/delta-3 isoform X3 n=1 Tax=Venturia canescens TaxID=32260 RepID=UPI001C9C1052|nr:voltage-dependent calcium channel subunit alpha-2/delta-3 isoform X3 [Venturia canescens]